MNNDDYCALASTPLCVCVKYIGMVRLLVKQFSFGYFFYVLPCVHIVDGFCVATADNRQQQFAASQQIQIVPNKMRKIKKLYGMANDCTGFFPLSLKHSRENGRNADNNGNCPFGEREKEYNALL